MAHTLRIVPDKQMVARLNAPTKTKFDDMERALVASNADYVIEGPKWIGASFGMTPEAHEVFKRLGSSRDHRSAPKLAGAPREFVRYPALQGFWMLGSN